MLLIVVAVEAISLSNETFVSSQGCCNNFTAKVEITSNTSDLQKFVSGMVIRDNDFTPMVYRFNYELAPL